MPLGQLTIYHQESCVASRRPVNDKIPLPTSVQNDVAPSSYPVASSKCRLQFHHWQWTSDQSTDSLLSSKHKPSELQSFRFRWLQADQLTCWPTTDETIEVEMDKRLDRYMPDSELNCTFSGTCSDLSTFVTMSLAISIVSSQQSIQIIFFASIDFRLCAVVISGWKCYAKLTVHEKSRHRCTSSTRESRMPSKSTASLTTVSLCTRLGMYHRTS